MILMAASCPKPGFTEQLSHASIGGAIALSVFMVCVTAVVIAILVTD